MANKGKIRFVVDFIGDGVSTTWATDIATGPFTLIQPGSGGEISSSFSLVTTVPTNVSGLSCDGGLGVTAGILLGIVTFTFTGGPPANGTAYSIQGTFEF